MMNSIVSKIYFYLVILFFSWAAHAYVPVSTDSRIKTLIYSPNEVFYLNFHYNYQSYIEFPEDERVNIISLGDRYSWNVKKIGQRIFIKPYQIGGSTNMTIITDKREYHFEIYSSTHESEFADPKLAYVVKFFYPETVYDYMESIKIRKPIKVENKVVDKVDDKAEPAKEANIVIPVPTLIDEPEIIPEPIPQPNEDLLDFAIDPLGSEISDSGYNEPVEYAPQNNYRYSMVGNEASQIRPFIVFDDGENTFFTFESNVLPDIFVVNPDGTETYAEYRIIDNQVVVNTTSWQFSLRNNKEVICIFNDNLTDMAI